MRSDLCGGSHPLRACDLTMPPPPAPPRLLPQGNYAGALEYTYHSAAVVFELRHTSPDVLRAKGPEVLCTLAAKLARPDPSDSTALRTLRQAASDCVTWPGSSSRCETALKLLGLVSTAAQHLRSGLLPLPPSIPCAEKGSLGEMTDVAKIRHTAGSEGTGSKDRGDTAGRKRRRGQETQGEAEKDSDEPDSANPGIGSTIPAPAADEQAVSSLRALRRTAVRLLGMFFRTKPATRSGFTSLAAVATAVEALASGGASASAERWGGDEVIAATEALLLRGGVASGPARVLCLADCLLPWRERLVRSLLGSVWQSGDAVDDAPAVAEWVWGVARAVLKESSSDSAGQGQRHSWAHFAHAVCERLLTLISAASSEASPALAAAAVPAVTAAAAEREELALRLVAARTACIRRIAENRRVAALHAELSAAAQDLATARTRVQQHSASVVHARAAVEKAARALPQPGSPPFAQPTASLPHVLRGRTDIEAFLRGPERTRTFRPGASGIIHARTVACTYFGGSAGTGSVGGYVFAHGGSGYCADAVASGSGANAVVTITKREMGPLLWSAHKASLQALETALQAGAAIKASEAAAQRRLEAAEAAVKKHQESTGIAELEASEAPGSTSRKTQSEVIVLIDSD